MMGGTADTARVEIDKFYKEVLCKGEKLGDKIMKTPLASGLTSVLYHFHSSI